MSMSNYVEKMTDVEKPKMIDVKEFGARGDGFYA